MEERSISSEEMLKAAEEMLEAMENEAASQNRKGRALLTELSKGISNRQQKGSKKSTSEGKAKHPEATPSESFERGTKPDSILESVIKSVQKQRPDLTEEEIIEAAGGLLG